LDGRQTLQSVLDSNDELAHWLMSDKNHWTVGYRCDEISLTERLRVDLLRFIFEWTVSHRVNSSSGKSYIQWIVDKSVTHHEGYYELFNHYFHGYRRAILHLVRDPRDVAVSLWYWLMAAEYRKIQNDTSRLEGDERQACIELFTLPEGELSPERHFFTTPDFLEKVFRRWGLVNRNLHVAAKTNSCPYLLIRYEDMRLDKVGCIERIAGFLELSSPPDGYEDYGSPIGTDRVPRFDTFRRGRVGEWAKWLSDDQVRLCARECGYAMTEFGYTVR